MITEITASTARKMIEAAGGPAKLGKKLGYSRQRVHNWSAGRGIPPQVILEHYALITELYAQVRRAR